MGRIEPTEPEGRLERWLQRAERDTLDDAERVTIERIRGIDEVDELVAMLDETRAGEEDLEEPDGRGAWREVFDSTRYGGDLGVSTRQRVLVDRLAELDTSDSVASLGDLVKSRDRNLAAIACRGLAETSDDAAIPYLMEALSDRRFWAIRTNAAAGLARRQHRPAYPGLVALLKSDYPTERVVAARSIALTGDRSLEPDLRRARRWEWRPWTRWSMPRKVDRPQGAGEADTT